VIIYQQFFHAYLFREKLISYFIFKTLKMVFVRTPFLPNSKSVWLPAENVSQCRTQIEDARGIPSDILIFYYNGRRALETQTFDHNATVDVALSLLGGKGGFGSMLRALGAQIEKTTNNEACRDLSGRRLRDINEESRLKNYVAGHAEREREKAKKKEEKLEKLRKLVNPKFTGNGGKHDFHDPSYNKEREVATERVHDAMEQAFSKKDIKEKDKQEASCSNESDKDNSTSNFNWAKRKAEDQAKPSTKNGPSKPKKGLWVGVDLSDSDLESSSDEEKEPTVKNKGTGKGKSSNSKVISVK